MLWDPVFRNIMCTLGTNPALCQMSRLAAVGEYEAAKNPRERSEYIKLNRRRLTDPVDPQILSMGFSQNIPILKVAKISVYLVTCSAEFFFWSDGRVTDLSVNCMSQEWAEVPLSTKQKIKKLENRFEDSFQALSVAVISTATAALHRCLSIHSISS